MIMLFTAETNIKVPGKGNNLPRVPTEKISRPNPPAFITIDPSERADIVSEEGRRHGGCRFTWCSYEQAIMRRSLLGALMSRVVRWGGDELPTRALPRSVSTIAPEGCQNRPNVPASLGLLHTAPAKRLMLDGVIKVPNVSAEQTTDAVTFPDHGSQWTPL